MLKKNQEEYKRTTDTIALGMALYPNVLGEGCENPRYGKIRADNQHLTCLLKRVGRHWTARKINDDKLLSDDEKNKAVCPAARETVNKSIRCRRLLSTSSRKTATEKQIAILAICWKRRKKETQIGTEAAGQYSQLSGTPGDDCSGTDTGEFERDNAAKPEGREDHQGTVLVVGLSDKGDKRSRSSCALTRWTAVPFQRTLPDGTPMMDFERKTRHR